jgi:hypothetical protein
VIGVAAGQNVEIYVIAKDGGGYHRVVFVAAGELSIRIECFCIDHCPLFNPAYLVFLCLDFEEPVATFEDYEPLAVYHFGNTIGDGGDAVLQIHLPGGDVHSVVLFVVESRAAAEDCKQAHKEHWCLVGSDEPMGRDDRDWRMREHSQWRSSSG